MSLFLPWDFLGTTVHKRLRGVKTYKDHPEWPETTIGR